MTTSATMGLLGGVGAGITDLAKMYMKDDMETVRREGLAKLQGERDVKLFGQKKEMSVIEQEQKKEIKDIDVGQKEKDRGVKVSEGALDRESREKVAEYRAQAKKDAAAAKGGKPTTSWKKYQELKAEFKRMNPTLTMPAEVEATLLNAAYGTAENVKTDYGFSRVELTPTGATDISLQVGRGPDQTRREARQSPQVTKSTGGMLSQTPPAAPAAPTSDKGKSVSFDVSRHKPGTYKLKNGKILTIESVNGVNQGYYK